MTRNGKLQIQKSVITSYVSQITIHSFILAYQSFKVAKFTLLNRMSSPEAVHFSTENFNEDFSIVTIIPQSNIIWNLILYIQKVIKPCVLNELE